MIFYKNVLISTILSALILIAIVGGIMFYFKNSQVYPPVIDACPDYYNFDDYIKGNMKLKISKIFIYINL